MAAEAVKNVRILTKSEQKQSIKGVPKRKKNIIKNYLESPFALEWPKLTVENEKEITALLRESCLGLPRLDSKPPWKETAKYRGAERKAFLKEHHQKFQEKLDPETMKRNKEREEALSHLIFGYNAVMRAMEQDRVAGIILKKNMKPDFITKAFLPGCAMKGIPLVPLDDLEEALRDKETLALPHTCMVLGLRPSVKDKANRFHLLFMKMREALDVEETEDETSEEGDDSIEAPATEEVKESFKPTQQLTEVDISSYHLKRSDIKGRRAFVPDGSELRVKETNLSDDFLSFEATQDQTEARKPEAATTQPKEAKEKYKSLKTLLGLDENIDFSSMILVDASGEEKMLEETPLAKQEAAEGEKPGPGRTKGKRKRKRKKRDSDVYVPAKTKQIRGNPNRRGRGK